MVTEEKMNELERIVVNIVKRNKLNMISEIQELAQNHFGEEGYPNNHQIRYIMKKAGIKMDGNSGFFVITDDTIEIASRVCMRCDKNKALKNYHRIAKHPVHDGYLLICKVCVKEESLSWGVLHENLRYGRVKGHHSRRSNPLLQQKRPSSNFLSR